MFNLCFSTKNIQIYLEGHMNDAEQDGTCSTNNYVHVRHRRLLFASLFFGSGYCRHTVNETSLKENIRIVEHTVLQRYNNEL